MKIVCIAASQVPSSTANSIQVMKACQALAQLGHEVRLLVPQVEAPDGQPASTPDLKSHYGLETIFPIEWLPTHPRWKRYDFCWRAVQRAKALGADLVYVWPLQAACFALLAKLPVVMEMHGPPEGALGPWLFRLFLKLPGRKRLLPSPTPSSKCWPKAITSIFHLLLLHSPLSTLHYRPSSPLTA
jgi:hypothetical protein